MGPLHVLEFASAPPPVNDAELRVHVVYTGPQTIRTSLDVAAGLACDLGATLELLVANVVPYPIPLNSPTTPPGFIANIVSSSLSNCGVNVNVKVLLCRDREETIPRWLPSESIAVIGRRRRFGPGSFSRLIRLIRREGHHVIVVDRYRDTYATEPVLKSRARR